MKKDPISIANVKQNDANNTAKELKGQWVLDTNLLIYALDKGSKHYLETYELFELINSGQFIPAVSTQNITEAVNVLVNQYKLSGYKAAKEIGNLLDGFDFQIITPLVTTTAIFFNLISSRKKRDTFDMFLAATLLDNDVSNLLTANNKDFNGVDGLTVVNPFRR